jgi:enterochelin esterase-like enzyme
MGRDFSVPTRFKTIIVCALATVAAQGQDRQCSVTGDLEIVPFSSSVFPGPRNLRVLLPERYRTAPSRQYPVLYLNDGQNLFDVCTSLYGTGEWRVDETVTGLIAQGRIAPIIVVGMDNGGRQLRPVEYLPWPDETLRPPVAEPHGSLYPRFLLEEVVPYIEGHYRVMRGAANRAIGGSSYGAGIALYTLAQRPGTFSGALLESPSVYADDYHLLKDAASVRQWPHRVYLGTGTVREPVGDTRRLAALFQQAGLGTDRLKLVVQEGGEHSEQWWARRLAEALEFLFPPPARAPQPRIQ